MSTLLVVNSPGLLTSLSLKFEDLISEAWHLQNCLVPHASSYVRAHTHIDTFAQNAF